MNKAKGYFYNDRVFESYDDAAIACAEDGHLGSSCKEFIQEIDFVRSIQPEDRGPYDLGFTRGYNKARAEVIEEVIQFFNTCREMHMTNSFTVGVERYYDKLKVDEFLDKLSERK